MLPLKGTLHEPAVGMADALASTGREQPATGTWQEHNWATPTWPGSREVWSIRHRAAQTNTTTKLGTGSQAWLLTNLYIVNNNPYNVSPALTRNYRQYKI